MRRAGASATATATASEEGVGSARGAAYLYLVLECRRPWAGGARWSLSALDDVQIGRGAERDGSESGRTLKLTLPDSRLSSRHARLTRLAGGWAFEDLDSKNGSRVRGAATKRCTLEHGDVIELGETLLLYREEEVSGAAGETLPPGLATLSPALALEHAKLASIAASEVPVLIVGETGTGKELAARAIHQISGRSGRMVAVNCGAIATSIIEAELFGHRQGAFSGASEARPGLVRAASKGTLFLDEVAELPLAAQAALLRVLQEKEVLPVGETTPVRVDVRVIAATHRDLRAAAEAGRFRLDLLARLEGYTARLVPLRERVCDMGLLIAVLLERIAGPNARSITLHAQAARALLAHEWPKNVRELELALASAVALATDGVITLASLPEALREGPVSAPVPVSQRAAAPLSGEDEELKKRLVALLEEHGGSLNGVARAMRKDRTQIRRWVARFQIDVEQWRR